MLKKLEGRKEPDTPVNSPPASLYQVAVDPDKEMGL